MGEVWDVLHDEVYRHPVVAEPWDNDVREHDGWEDEVAEGVLDELVVLFQHADDRPATLSGVPLESPAEADVV